MYNLFLDDMRDPRTAQFLRNQDFYRNTKWVVVKNYDEFVSYITHNGMPDLISFDHDLGSGKTGYDVACYIELQAERGVLPHMTWVVHSANPVGAEKIRRAMESAERYWALSKPCIIKG